MSMDFFSDRSLPALPSELVILYVSCQVQAPEVDEQETRLILYPSSFLCQATKDSDHSPPREIGAVIVNRDVPDLDQRKIREWVKKSKQPIYFSTVHNSQTFDERLNALTGKNQDPAILQPDPEIVAVTTDKVIKELQVLAKTNPSNQVINSGSEKPVLAKIRLRADRPQRALPGFKGVLVVGAPDSTKTIFESHKDRIHWRDSTPQSSHVPGDTGTICVNVTVTGEDNAERLAIMALARGIPAYDSSDSAILETDLTILLGLPKREDRPMSELLDKVQPEPVVLAVAFDQEEQALLKAEYGILVIFQKTVKSKKDVPAKVLYAVIPRDIPNFMDIRRSIQAVKDRPPITVATIDRASCTAQVETDIKVYLGADANPPEIWGNFLERARTALAEKEAADAAADEKEKARLQAAAEAVEKERQEKDQAEKERQQAEQKKSDTSTVNGVPLSKSNPNALSANAPPSTSTPSDASQNGAVNPPKPVVLSALTNLLLEQEIDYSEDPGHTTWQLLADWRNLGIKKRGGHDYTFTEVRNEIVRLRDADKANGPKPSNVTRLQPRVRTEAVLIPKPVLLSAQQSFGGGTIQGNAASEHQPVLGSSPDVEDVQSSAVVNDTTTQAIQSIQPPQVIEAVNAHPALLAKTEVPIEDSPAEPQPTTTEAHAAPSETSTVLTASIPETDTNDKTGEESEQTVIAPFSAVVEPEEEPEEVVESTTKELSVQPDSTQKSANEWLVEIGADIDAPNLGIVAKKMKAILASRGQHFTVEELEIELGQIKRNQLAKAEPEVSAEPPPVSDSPAPPSPTTITEVEPYPLVTPSPPEEQSTAGEPGVVTEEQVLDSAPPSPTLTKRAVRQPDRSKGEKSTREWLTLAGANLDARNISEEARRMQKRIQEPEIGGPPIPFGSLQTTLWGMKDKKQQQAKNAGKSPQPKAPVAFSKLEKENILPTPEIAHHPGTAEASDEQLTRPRQYVQGQLKKALLEVLATPGLNLSSDINDQSRVLAKLVESVTGIPTKWEKVKKHLEELAKGGPIPVPAGEPEMSVTVTADTTSPQEQIEDILKLQEAYHQQFANRLGMLVKGPVLGTMEAAELLVLRASHTRLLQENEQLQKTNTALQSQKVELDKLRQENAQLQTANEALSEILQTHQRSIEEAQERIRQAGKKASPSKAAKE